MWLALYCALGTGCTWPQEYIPIVFSPRCTNALTACATIAQAALELMPAEVVPSVAVIDDFKLTSAYLPLTRRREPTVTIGKRELCCAR